MSLKHRDAMSAAASKTLQAARDERLTDPYGSLEYAVGSGDDFWCFDFYVDHPNKRVRLHAVINSETGSFIQDAEAPEWWSFGDAPLAAVRLVYAALDWCSDNQLRHTVRGWNQDPMYFARSVARAVATAQGQRFAQRVGRKNGKTPEVSL